MMDRDINQPTKANPQFEAMNRPARSKKQRLWTRLFFLALPAVFILTISYGLNYFSPKITPVVSAQEPAKKPRDPQDTDLPPRTFPAPELTGGVEWLNTANPIRIKDLRGKIVILDFWTLCCINCIHTLPDLAKLEKKYANEVVVIGVHSAKFDNEKDTNSIRKAILRYEITHPVVNDANRKIWDTYETESWPTLVVIDPEGNLVGKGQGEGLYEAVDSLVTKLIKVHREKKTLDEKPMKFDLIRKTEPGDGPLYFPGKVTVDPAGKRILIADSTHHRIVVTDLEGKKIAIAGNGTAGNVDGSFEIAEFHDPQGMAIHGDTLYVADRKNHAIRQLDLKKQTVTTLAGIGKQGMDRRRGGPGLKTGLNSPWDLLLVGDTLFIAMAGHHQIWTLDVKTNNLTPFAGSGAEQLIDGPFSESAFAQPSGLTTDGKNLYVADSETSSVRVLPLKGPGEVKTLVGRGLFEFGDLDGKDKAVRLQHALGVAFSDGKVYVADTYNSKLKVIDPESRTCKTVSGSDEKGWSPKPVLNEPGGICVADGKLYLADTNAHRIRIVDLKTLAISTLKLQGVEAPKTRGS